MAGGAKICSGLFSDTDLNPFLPYDTRNGVGREAEQVERIGEPPVASLAPSPRSGNGV